jgi:hypothetical protein
MAESVGYFGDVRRERRGAEIFERIVARNSLVQRKVGGDRAGEIAMDRFLGCPEVTKEEILRTLSRRTAERCAGRRVVVAQDTTEVNFSGRELGRIGLGPGGDGASAGFFIHAAVAIDAEDEAVLGLAAAEIWTRRGKIEQSRRKRGPADKESARWLRTAQSVEELQGAAGQVIVVADRECDIYPFFVHRPEDIDLVVRSAQNRSVEDGGLLFEEPLQWQALSRTTLTLVPRKPGERPRTARLELRAGRVRLRRPRTVAATELPFVELSFVEAREVEAPKGVQPLHWRLLSSLPADNAGQAAEIVRLYRLRWRIEQVFRALKNDGLQLPDVQMQRADKLLKLAALGLGAAVRILQLVDARHRSSRPASDVADPLVIHAASLIAPTLQGRTARQQNPHPHGSLSWLSWLVARLGGWNCYYKPPGPKTMAHGWNRLIEQARGILLASNYTHNV